MRQFIEIFILFLFGWLTLIPLLIVVKLLFNGIVADGQRAIERYPRRALLTGFVNFLFLSIISLASFALADNLGAQFLGLPGLLTTIVLLALSTFGLAGVAGMLGDKISPETALVNRLLRGGSLFYLACWFPFIGWFGLAPYAVLLGLGGCIYGLLQRFYPAQLPAANQTVQTKTNQE